MPVDQVGGRPRVLGRQGPGQGVGTGPTGDVVHGVAHAPTLGVRLPDATLPTRTDGWDAPVEGLLSQHRRTRIEGDGIDDVPEARSGPVAPTRSTT
ncbi:hypothetical protein FRIGORI9N_120014 [Frigoribacterium sp. 9N]|nr:hypothetical protein FRIGORI9N_120014 [Frigoribacterium sp. 9N]